MALLTRLSRLFLADAHAVLDHIEEPRALLRQSMRDMAAELAAMEQRCQCWQDDMRHAALEEQQLQETHAQLTEELDLSLSAQREDLARQVLRRRLELEQVLQALRKRMREANHRLEQEQQRISQCRQQLQEMQQRASLYTSDEACEADRQRPLSPVVSDDAVELALLREKQQRSPS